MSFLKQSISLVATAALASAAFAVTVDLEDLGLAPESFYNGSDLAGGFTSQGAFFNNSYNTTFGSWSGWAASTVTDVSTPGFGNQYSAYVHLSPDADNAYAVAYNFAPGVSTITLPAGFDAPLSADITNTTYAALSMLQGDGFSKQFGGESGDDPDFFKVTFSGYDVTKQLTGSFDFYLADYRFADNSLDYVVDDWTTVDFTPLGTGVRTIAFAFESSDVGQFGINTPTTLALDNLVVVPEPSALALLAFGGLGLVLLRRRR